MKNLWRSLCVISMLLGSQGLALASQSEFQERSLTKPTAWKWYTSASEKTINDQIDKGFRPIDIEVVGTSPYRFAVTLVKNSDSYQRSRFWWYFGRSGSQVKELLSRHKARILDLEIHWINGKKRYAVILVSNTGSDSRAWWYYSQIKYPDLKKKIGENKARLIDLDTYTRNGTRYYSAVMIRNSGKERKSWWWYTNLTRADIKSKLAQHKARIVDIERRSSGKYTVILERAKGKHWSWFVGVSAERLKVLIGNWGHRITDIERYQEKGATRFAVLMLNNSNRVETAVADFMRPGLDKGGTFGFYLRRRGGPTLASRRAETSVYPASTIKVIHHLYAMREVDRGSASLNDSLRWYENASQSCSDSHSGHNAARDSLRTLLRAMMEQSDNQATNAIQEFFGGGSAPLGRQRMNAMAREVVGMSAGTRLEHKLGCGGDRNDPSNLLRLKDMARLYDRVASGALMNDANREIFYDLMLERSFIDSVIDDEAPRGVDVASFKSSVRMAHKAGGSGNHKSMAGWVRLPTDNGSREYVYGVFLESGDDVGLRDSVRELLRREIGSALATFK